MAVVSRSFTSFANPSGLLNVLKNQCSISLAYDPRIQETQPPICQFDAIWDTGATHSVITQKVVAACGLAATGMAMVHGVHGASETETYLVNVYLPNQVTFGGVRVTKGNLRDADILIGMDIISQGDFAVTNLGGLTKFSFRYPSMAHIDFVAEARKSVPTHGGLHPAERPKRPKPPKRKKKK